MILPIAKCRWSNLTKRLTYSWNASGEEPANGLKTIVAWTPANRGRHTRAHGAVWLPARRRGARRTAGSGSSADWNAWSRGCTENNRLTGVRIVILNGNIVFGGVPGVCPSKRASTRPRVWMKIPQCPFSRGSPLSGAPRSGRRVRGHAIHCRTVQGREGTLLRAIRVERLVGRQHDSVSECVLKCAMRSR